MRVDDSAREQLRRWMARLAEGDREAFTPAFACLQPLLGRFCARLLPCREAAPRGSRRHPRAGALLPGAWCPPATRSFRHHLLAIWFVERTEKGWGTLRLAEGLNTPESETNTSVTREGAVYRGG